MNVRFAPASLLLGGFLAGSALAARLSYDIGSLIGTTSRETSFPTDAAAVALGALAAVLVATWVRHRRAVAALSLLGLALLTLAPLPGSWRFEVYPQAVGAGLLLGGLVGLGATTNRATLQTALAAGVLGGLLLAGPLRQYQQWARVPERYADYLPGPAPAPADSFALTLLALTGAMLLLALLLGEFGGPAAPAVRARYRTLVVGLALPIIGLLLQWRSARSPEASGTTAIQGHWVIAVLAIPVVIAAALWLPGRSGAALLAVLAFAIAGSGTPEWSSDSWPTLLMPVVLVLAGAVLGRRWPRPLWGMAALGLVAASALFEQAPWDNLIVQYRPPQRLHTAQTDRGGSFTVRAAAPPIDLLGNPIHRTGAGGRSSSCMVLRSRSAWCTRGPRGRSRWGQHCGRRCALGVAGSAAGCVQPDAAQPAGEFPRGSPSGLRARRLRGADRTT